MRVDIVTPSSSASHKELQNGIQFLKRLNLTPYFYGGFSKNSFFAQEEKLSARFFKKSLLNKDTEIIWSLRGGYGSQRLLRYLNKINKRSLKRKIFIGYSDATVLHDWIHHYLKWPSLHFPVLSALQRTSSRSKTKLKELIQRKIKFVEFFCVLKSTCMVHLQIFRFSRNLPMKCLKFSKFSKFM